MIFVRPNLQKFHLVSLFNTKTYISQSLIDLPIEHRSPILCRKHQMIEQDCYVVTSVNELAHPQTLRRKRRGMYPKEIHAFERDFVPEGEPGSEEGYVLLTNGMSNRRMTLPVSGLSKDEKPRAELMWYVREPTPEIIANLRWLAKLPFIDSTWFGFGHRVPMPDPPLTDCDLKTFLFLTPILGPDQRIAETLSIDGDAVEILTVNLISEVEYQFIKQKDGLNSFLDILDEKNYPLIFDPKRKSYI